MTERADWQLLREQCYQLWEPCTQTSFPTNW